VIEAKEVDNASTLTIHFSLSPFYKTTLLESVSTHANTTTFFSLRSVPDCVMGKQRTTMRFCARGGSASEGILILE